MRLNWGGRPRKEKVGAGSDASSTSGSPYQTNFSFEDDVSPLFSTTTAQPGGPENMRYLSNLSNSASTQFVLDPAVMQASQANAVHTLSQAGTFDQPSYFQGTNNIFSPPPYASYQFHTTFEVPSASSSDFEPYDFQNAGFSPTNADMHSLQNSAEIMAKYHKYSFSTASPGTTVSDACSPNTDSDEAASRVLQRQQSYSYNFPHVGRVSVQSMINGKPEDTTSNHDSEAVQRRQYPIADKLFTIHGYDCGLPDYDIPNNDDFAAIAILSPQSHTVDLDDESTYENAKSPLKHIAFETGGYYAKPVPIRIQKSLGTLPPLLMENPMNLLYFHHFINHTARILVPHDCERNPFRHILPEMAVRHENIMNLLLAYSAAHRARMLNHREPTNRIAVWLQDVFPKLRQTLIDSPNDISDDTLAVVIMMVSLEVICSGTFEVPVSWQNHLTMARQMIIARGGPNGMGRQDRVAFFLSRWFAYLDVLGSLSGSKNDVMLGSIYWSHETAYADEDFEIDCLLGFTTHCVGSLARISELAKQCEPHRIDDQGNVREHWIPDPTIVQEAIKIRRALEQGLLDRNMHKGCSHRCSASSEFDGTWDATEIYATNELFHWAGLIHLQRRVLGKPAMDVEVQHAVREIVGLLYKIRRGSTAEACLIFPMFAAGCDTLDQGQRDKIMDRLRGVEGFGLTHVPKISNLMQRVWDTGKPWESLVSGEFFG